VNQESVNQRSVNQGPVNQPTNPNVRPFLLMEGGPLFRLEKRVGLIKANAPLTIRRAILAATLAWLPLLILSLIQGVAYGDKVPVPFLRDFSTYSRFLLALPLLLLAEIILGPRIAESAAHFVTSGLVTPADYPKFDAEIADGLRLRDSTVAEIIILILAYVFNLWGRWYTTVHVSTWHTLREGDLTSTTLAGWWLILFSTPLFQFLMIRWLWRLFLWFRFLSHVRRLDLQLFPTHPDEAAGLGFVGEAQRFFGILLFAYSMGVCGVLADQVVYNKTPLSHFAPAIAAYVIIALLIMVAPLIVFSGKLLAEKRKGLHQYGTLATSYTGDFHKKWILGQNPSHDGLLGTGDIQSLADLGNSYAFIEKMNAIPINPRSLLHLIVATLLPLTPLLLTVMPLKDVLKLLLKVAM
jgi:hypothetical protein